MALSYKVLGQVNPSDTNNANLYTVPSGTSTVVSTLVLTNVTATDAVARMYVRKEAAAASTDNAIAYDVTVAANSLNTFTLGITLGATDVLTVHSATANALAFHLFGSEIS